jgi:hypothetical protein
MKGLIAMVDKAKNNDGWDNVSDVEAGFATTFMFNDIGETFIGHYLELTEIGLTNGDIATAAIFADSNGERIGIWANHDLLGKLKKVDFGSEVRIEFTAEREIRRGLSPMKEFSVKAK